MSVFHWTWLSATKRMKCDNNATIVRSAIGDIIVFLIYFFHRFRKKCRMSMHMSLDQYRHCWSIETDTSKLWNCKQILRFIHEMRTFKGPTRRWTFEWVDWSSDFTTYWRIMDVKKHQTLERKLRQWFERNCVCVEQMLSVDVSFRLLRLNFHVEFIFCCHITLINVYLILIHVFC